MMGKRVSRMGSVRICEGDDGSHSHPFSLSNLPEDVDICNHGEHIDSVTETMLINSVISINFGYILKAIADAPSFISHSLGDLQVLITQFSLVTVTQ